MLDKPGYLIRVNIQSLQLYSDYLYEIYLSDNTSLVYEIGDDTWIDLNTFQEGRSYELYTDILKE